jgi:UDP-N-acetylmuramoyl-tripeptide--D-alanyl-D-alanine ligase
VKDLIAGALAPSLRTAASERSFNNELGVPLTLLNAPEGTEVVVLELGARGAGHIADLCEVAAPTVGVVTAVAAVHTETFGTLDDVARAKGELVSALPAEGTAVLNADDPLVAAMAGATSASVLLAGLAAGAEVTATGVELDDELRPSFRLWTPWGDAGVRLAVRGHHQVGNALLAAGAALVVGAPLEAVAAGLEAPPASPWRMALGRAPSGLVVVNDAYNANPTSMAAALRALAALPARRRFAYLGTMAELGPGAAAAHREVAGLAGELGIAVVAVDEPAYGTEHVRDVDEALAHAVAVGAGDGDAVLVKASRVAGLERLAARLLDGDRPSP